jgi:hypothetical protein
MATLKVYVMILKDLSYKSQCYITDFTLAYKN